MKKVLLDYWECIHACNVGLTRHIESCVRGRKARFPERKPDELLLHHQHGALAEAAFSKLAQVYWGGHINRFHEADVGLKIEVRWSARPDLKIRADDNDIYVVSMSGALSDCVDRKFPFVYNGYIYSEDAKQERWLKDPNGSGAPAYFVPHTDLNIELPPRD
tara:strand:- start:37 stop:522 length:486 start_codon:yes stop_codon:yes gene_type:complete